MLMQVDNSYTALEQTELIQKARNNGIFATAQPYTPHDIIRDITLNLTVSKSKPIAVLYTIEWAVYLRAIGYTDITVITRDADTNLQKICSTFGFNYIIVNKSMPTNKTFAAVVGNPPFNISAGGKSGVAGHTGLWTQFVKLGFELAEPGGQVAMICSWNPSKLLKTVDAQIDTINFMSETKHWEYRTQYFIGRNEPRTSLPVIQDAVYNKIFAMDRDDRFVSYRTEDTTAKPDVMAISSITKGNYLSKALVNKDKVVNGPKFMFASMHTTASYTVTDQPAAPKYAAMVPFDTVAEADKFHLFCVNNPIVKFFHKTLNAKNPLDIVLMTKRFDVNQIVTGYEYPVEWNLTPDEIDYIESTS